ncbi:hypothetical protein EGW08_013431 [Elysia chlorotica]|uniref:Alkaline ceramidase n=1 Tax=Elysia chlorotica TaxID=188477 RepID=A0A3S1B377_ELYCH|nr:hypothetical protein EGW08_013431 [Elysia chlorotica]
MAPIVEGYWGKQTATLDWCEENYAVTYYVAEFWNTLSNALMLLSPAVMVSLGLKENHEKRFVYSFVALAGNTLSNALMLLSPAVMVSLGLKENHEKRFVYSFVALAVVGLGSWLFHMTLRYSMQLMDEIPMIWGCSFQIYGLFMVTSKPGEKNSLLQIGLFSYCAVVTLVYILINNPIFHQVSYALLILCIVALSTRMLMTLKCSMPIYFTALFSYAFGFLLWNVDNVFCSQLRSIRELPPGSASGMLLECHAWWHIFAGFGTYMGILFAMHARYVYLKKNPQLKYILGFWPYLTLSDDKVLKLR